jgi:hypothetical protein
MTQLQPPNLLIQQIIQVIDLRIKDPPDFIAIITTPLAQPLYAFGRGGWLPRNKKLAIMNPMFGKIHLRQRSRKRQLQRRQLLALDTKGALESLEAPDHHLPGDVFGCSRERVEDGLEL